ncbi:hypothetical protein HK102_009640, partial [Quaeritorhiza haematococci]
MSSGDANPRSNPAGPAKSASDDTTAGGTITGGLAGSPMRLSASTRNNGGASSPVAGLNSGGGGGVGAGNGAVAAEERRPSLLDVVRDQLQRQGKTSMLYRLVLCGEVNKEIATTFDLANHYQRFFKQHQTETDLITGMLLLHGSTWVHVLE